jgi:hypothetical protein
MTILSLAMQIIQDAKVPYVSAEDPQVVLHPEDNDLIVRTGKQVISACQLNISVELWLHELTSLSAHVQAWAQRQPNVVSVHLTPQGGKIALFVSPRGESFDFDLADSLADLHMHLVKNFNVGMVEILQIPSKELDRFVDGARARAIYVNPTGSHSAVEAQ